MPFLIPAVTLSMIGCVPEPGAPATDTASSATAPVRDTDVGGFSLSGLAYDPFTTNDEGTLGLPAPEGLCVFVADPTPALATNDVADLDLLAAATTDDAGTFSLDGVDTISLVGLFLVVDDCTDDTDLVGTSITGVTLEDYGRLGEGDVLADQLALVLESTIKAVIELSLGVVGFTDDYDSVGAMIGFVLDADDVPVSGATIARADGEAVTVYYGDPEVSDGLFSTAGATNTATDASINGLFLIPGAALTPYIAFDDTHTYSSVFFGTVPGVTTFFAIRAD